MAILGGYIGIVKINSTYIKCSDCNININQDTLFYDHIIGLNDTIPTDLATKGCTEGVINNQKYLWRPGVKAVTGSLSFPATMANLKEVFKIAQTGALFTIDVYYACATYRQFTGCRINTFSFSIEVGDILTISIDVSATMITDSVGSVPTGSVIEKMITWDEVVVTPVFNSPLVLVTPNDGIRHFEFTINNNTIPIITHQSLSKNDFFPIKIRNGMQEVNGNFVFYNRGINLAGLDATTVSGTIGITVDTFSTTANVLYKPVSRTASVGFIPNTVQFVGVGKAFGEAMV